MNAKDIVTKTFDKAKLGGYKIEEVDEYLRDVSVEYKKLQNENEELEKKLEVLAAKVREYRKDEEALRDALLIAKKQGIAVVNESKEQADKIIKEAKEKADKTIKEATEAAGKKKAQSEKDIAEAKEKAEKIIAEANEKSEEIHKIMMQRTEREQIVLQRTRREVADYSAKLLSAYNAHIDYIKSIPEQCENEFIIDTVKEIASRKPEDSAFAKKAADKKETVKNDEKKEEKPAETKKEVAKPAENKAEPAAEEKKEAAKPADKKDETVAAEKKEDAKTPEKKEEAKAANGNSVLFKIGGDKKSKEESHEQLEFGQEK